MFFYDMYGAMKHNVRKYDLKKTADVCTVCHTS